MKDRAVRIVNRLHSNVYRRTDGRIGSHLRKAPVLLLTTAGRKSGKARTVPLVYLSDGARIVVVASYGGDDRSPQWFHNLVADPKVTVEVLGTRREMRAEVANADDKARLWPKLVKMYRAYATYQQRTEREIPVVILREIDPG